MTVPDFKPNPPVTSDQKPISELAALAKKAEEYLNGWKRAKADYQNFKKETEKRQAEIIQFANAALLAELLPIYNNFKLAGQHISADQKDLEWVKGFDHIQKQFTAFFGQLGLTEIKTVGEKFDPDWHEAVVHEAKEGFGPDIIFEEVSPGYKLHGKLLQAAKVKVAK